MFEKIENDMQAEEVELPEGILIYLQKRNGIVNPLLNNRYSVTDIIACQRKTYYKTQGVEEEDLLDDAKLATMWDSVRGDLLHKMTYAYNWREMDIEYVVPLDNGKKAILAGRLDMYDWKTKTAIELKTTKLIKWQIKQGFIPKTEHILQIQCYNTMFSQIIPIENLNIVYLDTTDIITYEVRKRDLTQWIKSRIQKLEDALSQKKIPAGEASSLCKYCRYQTRCSNEGNGLISKSTLNPKKHSIIDIYE